MKVRRDVASIPLRSAEETWTRILALVQSPDSVDADQLRLAAPVLTSLMTDELHDKKPLTFAGVGPRLVLYLSFDAAALELGPDVPSVDWSPTAGDWSLFVPCATDSLAWAQAALVEKAPRIVVHEPDANPLAAEPAAATALKADWGALES